VHDAVASEDEEPVDAIVDAAPGSIGGGPWGFGGQELGLDAVGTEPGHDPVHVVGGATGTRRRIGEECHA
jgi:hypothetical protein